MMSKFIQNTSSGSLNWKYGALLISHSILQLNHHRSPPPNQPVPTECLVVQWVPRKCRGYKTNQKREKDIIILCPSAQRSRVHVRVHRAVAVVFPYSIHIYFPSIPSSFVIRYLYIFFWRNRIFVSQHHLLRVRTGLQFRCEESERESAYGWWFGELFLPSWSRYLIRTTTCL